MKLDMYFHRFAHSPRWTRQNDDMITILVVGTESTEGCIRPDHGGIQVMRMEIYNETGNFDGKEGEEKSDLSVSPVIRGDL